MKDFQGAEINIGCEYLLTHNAARRESEISLARLVFIEPLWVIDAGYFIF